MPEDYQTPPAPPQQQEYNQQPLAPHRGTLILVLGIIGIVSCIICGIIAWVMGNGDLKEMDAGRMDPAGRDLTKAGKICGMISVILTIVVISIYLLIMVVGLSAGVMAQ